jgi:hypothetical protein
LTRRARHPIAPAARSDEIPPAVNPFSAEGGAMRRYLALSCAVGLAVWASPRPRAQSTRVQRIALAATTSIRELDAMAIQQSAATAAALARQQPNQDREELRHRPGESEVERHLATNPGPEIQASSAARANSHPELESSFDGINVRDHRTADGGQTFTFEPPDQGLCVGNGFVLETVNQALRVFDTSGTPLTTTISLNSFYGYPPARSLNQEIGPSIFDPSCYFDRDTQRWFHLANTVDRIGVSFEYAGTDHLDLAVSQTSNPLDGWNIYRIPAQNNGTQGTPDHHCPGAICAADYPHFGADANGIYITTNEFGFFAGGFQAAQIYALSKAALVSGDSDVAVTLIDTRNYPLDGHPGITAWPAVTPSGRYATAEGGTEYFLSSTEVFNASPGDNRLRIWALSNTQSLNTPQPALVLRHSVVPVETYADAPLLTQKKGDVPLADCLNDRKLNTPFGIGCWRYIGVPQPVVKERENQAINSGPTLTTQVTFEDGTLWTALSTAITFDDHQTRSGIAYFVLNPSVSQRGVRASVVSQGYLASGDAHLAFPAVGVTAAGSAVIAFSLMGRDDYPSAGFATLDGVRGAGEIQVIGEGLGPEDGILGYKATTGDPDPVARWGDYGAAAVDGESIWIGSEYIGQTCTFTEFTAGAFGTCGASELFDPTHGTRVGGANWYTRISKVTPRREARR